MSQAVIQQIRDGLPTIYDTQAVASQKLQNVRALISNREEAIIGKPTSTSTSSTVTTPKGAVDLSKFDK